jgi:oligoendopeptidase F
MANNAASELNNQQIPEHQHVHDWESLKPRFEELKDRQILSLSELQVWLKDRSDIEATLQEELGWRYIRQTCDTENLEKREALNFFIHEIEPHLAQYTDVFNKKLLENPFCSELDHETYFVYLRGIEKEIALFRTENIPLLTEIQTLSNEYGQITGSMTIEMEGKTLTFQQAANYLKLNDREKRREAYEKINRRRFADREKLENLFDKLLVLRQQVAINAGFANFRDYMFSYLGRFDYSSKQCLDFHESVELHVVPLIEQFEKERKQKLKLADLYPWDLEVDPDQLPPLAPYSDSRDLIEKSIATFNSIKPEFGDVLRIMQERGNLDLDSRIGKAPGGYNYPLYESGLPFIFMNAAGSVRDMITMMHEGGHAIHSWVSRNLELTGFKNTPSEIAEVASMAMELISMEHWQTFFPDEATYQRARKYQLEKILSILPWIATVDAFQHWIYTHPNHTREQRNQAWLETFRRFAGKQVDRSIYPEFEQNGWHRQLHIFEVPFYYIEYGIAQLGAIGIWRNYTQNPSLALQNYEASLSLGYLKTLPDLYKIAGIKFDFSAEHVQELVAFIRGELHSTVSN